MALTSRHNKFRPARPVTALLARPLQVALSAFVVLLLASAAHAVASSSGRTVMVLGDSISAAYGIQREQGWVALLEARLKTEHPSFNVVNASISGETTGGGLARLPNALSVHQPDIVIIELGGNDGLRGYPTQKMRANLDTMVQLVQDNNATALLVGMQIPPNYGPRYTRAFQETFNSIAETYELPFVPFLLSEVALEEGMMQRDGIHPTAEAQGMLLDAVWPVLAPLLSD